MLTGERGGGSIAILVRPLVIHCRPGLGSRGPSEYLVREQGQPVIVAGPFPDAATAMVAARALAEARGVELWLEDRDDRGRELPPRRLWPATDSGTFPASPQRDGR